LSEVDSVAARLRVVLFVAGFLGLGLAILISGITSHLALRPLRNLVRNARLVTSGTEASTKRLPVSSNDELGRLAGSFNELVDELNQTLSSLAGERARLETILGGMTETLLALGPDDRVTHVNQAARDLLTLGEAPIGQLLVELVRVPALGELIERVHREPDAVAESELALPHARQVLARAASIKSTGGIILVMLDISEIRRLEKVRRDFVANVSHELRTPIGALQALLENLVDGVEPPDPAALRTALFQTERLGRLVQQLLDLSRLESGSLALRPAPFPVRSLLEQATRECELGETFTTRPVWLRVSVQPGDLRVVGDAERMHQVIANLLENAVRHSPADGRVWLSAHAATDGVTTIEVADEGPGIPDGEAERVFERFHRVDAARASRDGGTGLGLAIARWIVDAHGGTIAVRPREPNGCRVVVELPR